MCGMTSEERAVVLMQALFPHPVGTCAISEVTEVCSVLEDGEVSRLVFQGRGPWRFLFDVMHGVLTVLGEDGRVLAIEEVATTGGSHSWRSGVIVTVRDVLDAVLRARVLDELDQWTVELLLQELEALVAEDSLAEAFGVAVAARDTVVALAVGDQSDENLGGSQDDFGND